jgi:uncharacterized protein
MPCQGVRRARDYTLRMRNAVLLATLLVLAALPASGQTSAPASPAPAVKLPPGMEQYYMVFLRRGPAWTSAVTPETTKVSQGHMANLQRLTKEGKLVVAGPFMEPLGDPVLAGILILRAASAAEAKALVDSDPGVKAGRFVYEMAPWLGPSTLRHD